MSDVAVRTVHAGFCLKFTESYGPHKIEHVVDTGRDPIIIYDPSKKTLTVKGPAVNINYQAVYALSIEVSP